MKKATFLAGVCLMALGSFSSNLPSPAPVPVAGITVSIGTSGKNLTLGELSKLKIRDFEKLTATRLTIFQKLSFKLSQRDLRKQIVRNDFIRATADAQYLKDRVVKNNFHLGGFLLGLFLAPIGVLIAYLINDDKKKARIKWAWLGLAALLVFGAFFLVLF